MGTRALVPVLMGVACAAASVASWGESAGTKQYRIDEDQVLICKHVRVTGSRIRQKVCKTKQQAVAEYRHGQESIQNMKRELEDIERAMRQSRPTTPRGGMSGQ
jgi:hypothetical protein